MVECWRNSQLALGVTRADESLNSIEMWAVKCVFFFLEYHSDGCYDCSCQLVVKTLIYRQPIRRSQKQEISSVEQADEMQIIISPKRFKVELFLFKFRG